MRQKISVSEAWSKLSHLPKRLQKDPDTVFEITVNGVSSGTQTRLCVGAKTPGW